MPSVDEAAARAAARKAFKAKPLAFSETAEEEWLRLQRLKAEDPISLQDAVNTSKALVEAVKAGDLDELRVVVGNAEEGEFLQAFILQAMMLAFKRASLALVKELTGFGAPIEHDQLSEAIHAVCEVTNRNNFGDAWRIVQLLVDGTGEFRLSINTPRSADGWTPLCVACSDACLPLVFKLLDLQADPNIITRANETPLSIVRRRQESDNEEQKEARGIISNMLRHYGGQDRWQDVLAISRKPPRRRPPGPEQKLEGEDGSTCIKQAVSATHTRFSA